MKESATSDNFEEIDLADLVSQMLARWKFIAIITLMGAIAAFAVSALFLPNVYESKATIYVQQSSVASSLLKSLPINLGSGSGSSSGYLVVLLKSDTMMRTLIRQMDLSKRLFPKKKNANIENVLEKLSGSISIQEGKTGNVDIVARANDSQLAADIVNQMIYNLGNMVSSSSKRKADYIATKLDETKNKMDIAENAMVNFQKKYKVTEISVEAKGIIEKMSQLDAQALALNVEIQQVQSQLDNGGDLNSLVDLEVKKKSLESTKALLTKEIEATQSKVNDLPNVALQYARLMRNVEILTKTYELLIEQYQMANISQHGEDGDYQVVDKAHASSKTVAPRKVLNAGLGGMISFFLAAFIVSKSSRATYRKRHYQH